MKTTTVAITLTAILCGTLSNAQAKAQSTNSAPDAAYAIVYSPAAKQVVDAKCIACHCSDSSSFLGKQALNWDTLPDLPSKKQIAKLKQIIKVLDKGKMPPKKAVKKDPSKAISDSDSATLKTWAQRTLAAMPKKEK